MSTQTDHVVVISWIHIVPLMAALPSHLCNLYTILSLHCRSISDSPVWFSFSFVTWLARLLWVCFHKQISMLFSLLMFLVQCVRAGDAILLAGPCSPLRSDCRERFFCTVLSFRTLWLWRSCSSLWVGLYILLSPCGLIGTIFSTTISWWLACSAAPSSLYS